MGTIINGNGHIFDQDTGQWLGAIDAKGREQFAGVAIRSPSTSIALDASADYGQLTISGATTINATGSQRGAVATMLIIADGTNVPAISGADEWASSFGYLNTARVINRLDLWHDGVARRFAWSQQAVPTPIDVVAPTAETATVENATPTVVNLVISEAADTGATPAPASLSVSGHTVSAAAWGTSTRLDITVSPAFVNGEAARTLAYSPGTNPIKDAAGNLMAAFSGKAITNNVGGGGYQAETTAFLANVSANGGTISGADAAIIDAFIAGAKTDGFFSKYERCYFFRGDDNASRSRHGASGLATNNGTTQDDAKGRVGGGANYFRTGWTPNTTAGGFSFYLRTAQPSDTTTRIPAGCRDSGSNQVYRLASNVAGDGTTTAGAVCGGFGGQPGPGNVQPAATGGLLAGHYCVVRQSATVCKIYRNGVQIGSTGTTSTTPASPANDMFLFASNAAGTANAFLQANSEIAFFATLSAALSDAEAAAEYTRVQAMQTAFGRGV